MVEYGPAGLTEGVLARLLSLLGLDTNYASPKLASYTAEAQRKGAVRYKYSEVKERVNEPGPQRPQ